MWYRLPQYSAYWPDLKKKFFSPKSGFNKVEMCAGERLGGFPPSGPGASPGKAGHFNDSIHFFAVPQPNKQS